MGPQPQPWGDRSPKGLQHPLWDTLGTWIRVSKDPFSQSLAQHITVLPAQSGARLQPFMTSNYPHIQVQLPTRSGGWWGNANVPSQEILGRRWQWSWGGAGREGLAWLREQWAESRCLRIHPRGKGWTDTWAGFQAPSTCSVVPSELTHKAQIQTLNY